nr:hypothetical protein [Tanacetum cinerariifolium]
MSVSKANVSEGLSKPVTTHNLPQITRQAVSNTSVLKLRTYRIDNRTTPTKAPQLPQTVKNTNSRVSTSTGVNHNTNVSKPQFKSNQSRDKVLPNNSQVKVKKTQVEVHPRIPSVSNKMKSVTACKDSLNSRILNANAVCATCNKCLVDSNHFACVTKMLNDVHARTKKPTVVPISTRKPKSQANKSVATHHKKQIAQLILFIVDSGCTKLMTGNLKVLCNFVEKFIGTVRFGNDQVAPILGYGDLVQGNVTINRVYYVEGLNHNLFSVGQFCDADLEVAFRKSTCFVREIFRDIVIGLPKLKYVKDQLCSSCELSKAKRSSFKSKVVLSSKGRLNLLYMDLCGPMWVASINGKKYILVIVDDYLRYIWTLFLRSKAETPEVLKEFLTMIQRNLQASVITVRTDKGTEFLNKTLNAFFKEEGIEHQNSTDRTPKRNGVVERRNRTLVEAARTMLLASKLPLFFWAKEIATACYTQNRSIIILTHGKTSYHIINDRKPSIKHLYIFCSNPQDKQPLTNIPSTSAPSTHTNVHTEENKNDQAKEGEQLQDNEFTNPFCAPTQDVAESSSHNIGNSNVPTFNQPQVSEYRWTKDHPLEQVRENPSRPVQTRR